jgi:chemotaxis methyl-accepting protein methylase
MRDDLFQELLERFQRSPAGYRKVRAGVEKRIRRHMHRLGLHDVRAYLKLVGEDTGLSGELDSLLAVSVSRFFRDRTVWADLAEKILPELVTIHGRHGRELSVWSAGCALGQEAYSFRILWAEFCRSRADAPGLVLWATDAHPGYLEKAMEGVYRKSTVRELPEALTMKYFREVGDHGLIRVIDRLKEGIFWRRHDFTREPPPHRAFQVILLRNNLLTYYSVDVQEAALKAILAVLETGGILVIGKGEKLPPLPFVMNPVAPGSPIYRKEAARP